MKHSIKFLVAGLLFLLASCTSLSGLALTTSDQLVPGAENSPDVLVVDPATVGLGEEFAQELEGKKFVLAPTELIKDNATKIDFSGESDLETTLYDTGGFLAGIFKTMFPPLAALEALFVLLSKRKRQHYASAIKALAPTDGSVDLREAILSLIRALGVAHSSEASKLAAESPKEEVTAVNG